MEATNGIDKGNNGKTTGKKRHFDLFKPVSVRPNGERIESGNWCLRFQHRGKRTCRSLGTADYRLAQQRAKEMVRTVKTNGWESATGIRGDATGIKIEDFLTRFKETATTRKLRPQSIVAIDVVLRRIAKEVGANQLRQLTRDKIQVWIEAATRQGLKPVTIRGMMKIAACPFSKGSLMAMAMQDIPNPFRGLVWPRVDAEPFRAPDRKWILDLMNTGCRELSGDARLAFVLALGAGLRWGEITTLTWGNVTGQGVRILAGLAKGRRERIVPLGEKLRKLLDSERRGATERVITQDSGKLNAHLCVWLRQHDVEDARPLHYLRKCFGSMAAADHGIFIASKLLGHSTIALTAATYAGVVDRLPAVIF